MLRIPCGAQSFEGILILQSSPPQFKFSKLTVRGDKTLLEVQIDSIESFSIIKDKSSELITTLKRKGELKYGFRVSHPHEENQNDLAQQKPNDAEIQITNEVKSVGGYSCTKLSITSGEAQAEAWVTGDQDFSFSTFFPEFIHGNVEPEFYKIRQAADKEGLIMEYRETSLDSEFENHFQLTVEEKEIAMDVFHPGPEYLVLDKEGMKQLYLDAQHDEQKKQQWEEFMELFGNQ